ncbi:MAG: hypothetical protein SFZ03_11425 [Candidatus Melainabacteria bacterium]|nr:hypothetical protein [Candidatus Melainabacteria bacterium]
MKEGMNPKSGSDSSYEMPEAQRPPRWYDEDPAVSQLVRSLRTLPPDCQQVFALLLSGTSDVWHQERLQDHLRVLSVGVDRHLSLWKSKSKRRWYDRDPLMHRAMNHLLLLEPYQRKTLAERLNPAVEAVVGYVSQCQVWHRPVLPMEIGHLIRLSLNGGTDNTHQYLEHLTHSWKGSQIRSTPISNAVFRDASDGMRAGYEFQPAVYAPSAAEKRAASRRASAVPNVRASRRRSPLRPR